LWSTTEAGKGYEFTTQIKKFPNYYSEGEATSDDDVCGDEHMLLKSSKNIWKKNHILPIFGLQVICENSPYFNNLLLELPT